MSDTPPPRPENHGDLTPTPDLMPRWVPIAIGVILVSLATLAVITGLRYRDNTLVNIVKPRRTVARPTAPAPGEPEPGGSFVLSGGESSNVPTANPSVDDASTPEIAARRGMKINATPKDAVVYVNEVPVGLVTQFDSDDEIYDFAQQGSYTVKLVAPGYKEREFIVTSREDAPTDVAEIQATLVKQK
ncbi:MAG: hypothetical protein ACXW2P_07190 [Thermoanaerobaculia bacterium]